jgi:hypothetical protein
MSFLIVFVLDSRFAAGLRPASVAGTKIGLNEQ